MDQLESAARNVVSSCLGINSGEKVLIIIDEHTENIGNMLFRASVEIGAEAVIAKMTPREVNGQEPPYIIAEAMKKADVVIAPTLKSLSHTKARRDANGEGVRIATLPGITEDIMKRTLNADYQNICDRSNKLFSLLQGSSKIRVTTQIGTDVTFNFKNREFHPDTGIIRENEFGNLPGGEVFAAPVEGLTNGVVVIDGSMSGVGVVQNPIKIIIQDGYAVKIEGGEEAAKLESLLSKFGKDGHNIAELGFGTNDMATLSGNVLEDEKVMGTIHVALGNSAGFGGKVSVGVHLDGIVKNPSVWVDDKLLMEKGKYLELK